MKKSILIPALLLAAVGGTGGWAYTHPGQLPYADELLKSMGVKAVALKKLATVDVADIPGSYKGTAVQAAEWGAPATLQEKLGQEILAKLSSTDEAAVKAFIAAPENRLLLAQWMLAEALQKTTDLTAFAENSAKALEAAEKAKAELEAKLAKSEGSYAENLKAKIASKDEIIAELKAEATHPTDMESILKRRNGTKLVGALTNNLDWMEQLLFTGEVVMPSRTIEMLRGMFTKRGRDFLNPITKDVCTATALEYGRYGWVYDKALERAKYFNSNWKKDRLNTVFDTINFYERRVLCGWKGNQIAGDLPSLEWALDNVHLPADQFGGSCWRCGYVLYNVFGDSIHGSNYYEPVAGMDDHNHMWKTQNVGGVCGGLSHFGTAAAVANGVPALTAGEPAHCAFIVLVDKKWTPCYSLSWERGLHWQPWTGNHRFSSLHCASELYSPEQAEATRLSHAYRVMAQLFAKAGQNDKALACHKAATKAQPLNYIAWRDYNDFLVATAPENGPAWRELNAGICKLLAPRYPETAAELLKLTVYPNLKKAVKEKKNLAASIRLFWESIDEMGPDRWAVEELASTQLSLFVPDKAQPDIDTTCRVYKHVLAACMGKKNYAPLALSWGNKLAEKKSPEEQKKLLATTTEAMKGGKSLDEETQTKLFAAAILSAEQAGDLSTFQSLGKLVPASARKDVNAIPDFKPFPGKLVSEGGLMRASSTSGFDAPACHPGVLSKEGGKFHTGKDADAWVMVELPKLANVTGVVAIQFAAANNWGRQDGTQVQYSESGKDDDWHDVGPKMEKADKRELRFDLTGEKPRAKFIRLRRVRPNGEFYHFNGIYVFGNPAA